MAIEITPLGFQKPDGSEAVRDGDNVISTNAQKSQDLLADARARLANVENAAGFTGGSLGMNDSAFAQTLATGTETSAALDSRLNTKVPPLVASAVASNPTVASSAATMAQNTAGLVPVWKASTAYITGQRVIAPNGDVVASKANFTSGATYSATNWNASTQDGRVGTAEANITALTGRELPDRGRATPAAFTNSADNITQKGSWAIWTGSDATTLGLPSASSGRLDVFPYGSIIVQTYNVVTSGGPITYSRTFAGTWGGWGQIRNLDYEGRELPDRGRATTTAFPNINNLNTKGSWAIWTGADATAMGLPLATAGRVDVFPYGNIVTQVFTGLPSGGPVVYYRSSTAGVWGAWGYNRNLDYETRLSTLESGSPAAKRRAGEPLTLPSNSASIDTRTAVGHRLPFRLAAPASNWAVNIRNYNDRANVTFSGALSMTGIYVGKAALDGLGRPTGAFASTPTQLVGAFTTDAAGAQYVSPALTYALEKDTVYLLAYGYTCAAQNNHSAVGGGFTSTDPASISATAPTVTQTQVSPLDVWLNAEVAASTPHNAYYGDSLTAGVSSALPVYDSWAKRHAMACGAMATIYAHSGTTMADWTNGSLPKLTKYSAMGKPDHLYWALGSNDIFGGADLATLQARFAVAYPLITAVTTRRMSLLTVLPRLDAAAPEEAVRKTWNAYLQDSLPGDALVCYDAAKALTDADAGTLTARWRATVGDLHLNSAGYARYAAGVLGTA